MSDKVWSEEMGEISGFGGGYEATCRAMVLAGIQWIDANPNADPHYQGFKNVFGIAIDTNDDARALDKVLLDAAKGDCTGAMHHAAVGHVLAYKCFGWDEYRRQLISREAAA